MKMKEFAHTPGSANVYLIISLDDINMNNYVQCLQFKENYLLNFKFLNKKHLKISKSNQIIYQKISNGNDGTNIKMEFDGNIPGYSPVASRFNSVPKYSVQYTS